MTRAAKASSQSVVVPVCCFIAGVVLTLVWTSTSKPYLQSPAIAEDVSGSTEAFNAVAEALSTSAQAINDNATSKLESLTRADLLIAIPSSLGRLPLVEASRLWRQGTRAVVVVESSTAIDTAPQKFKAGMAAAQEEFGTYPDLAEGPPAWHKPGDARAAMAPFLANHSQGADSYKWMLYGDDDTVFYLDNVLRMLEPLDPTMPYFITDHIWFLRSLTEELDDNRMHPARSAPRCLPCHYQDPLQGPSSSNEFDAPQGCPCTKDFLCAHDNLGVFGGAEVCNVHQHNWYFGHGGAGAILSSGLMKLASFEAVKQFVDTAMQGDVATTVMSGDGVFSQVMHTVMKIMPTDPGYGYFRPHIQMFDPAWRQDDTVGSRGKHPMAVMKRDAADDSTFQDMLPAMQSAADNSHLSAAAFMHQKFAGLFKQYSLARQLQSGGTPWFAVATAEV